ncbi:MAG: ABC transporter permease, partial [Chloroflexota bacterium]|nr:ABC transporter permease [Chloroflexota bacterium]
MSDPLIGTLAGIVTNATPLVIAALGETITERSGIVNLSLDGSIVLSAMSGFVVAYSVQPIFVATGMTPIEAAVPAVIAGALASMLVGALVALLVAFASIYLRQDQVAVGFVLTLLGVDLAVFLGTNFARIPGPQLLPTPLPILADIPILGDIFFRQSAFAYISYLLVIGLWVFLRTPSGLNMRAVGERPEAAFARGIPVNRLRYLYAALGGALVGLAGAAYSLNVRAGWTVPPAMQGDGWIALAIVIFGGWHPARVLFGAYLFAGLRSLASVIQRTPGLNINITLLNAAPWVLMILTLILVSSGALERLLALLPQ